MQIAICDDTAMEAEFLREMLERYSQIRPYIRLEFEVFSQAETLIKALKNGKRFDLYFLDIIMPGMDGMSLAKDIRGNQSTGGIIFLTSSPNFALDAFAVKALNYLVKPVTKERLFETMDDAITALGEQVEALAFILTADGDIAVKRKNIVTVEVTGHTLTYQTTGGASFSSKVLRVPFEQATADLQEDPHFICPHRSYLVNMAHVKKLDADGFTMDNGSLIPVSRLRFSAVRRAWAEYMAR